MRARRHVRRPPDLTSLFDVLFIVVFAALIRAAAAENAAAHPPQPVRPSAPALAPAVAALQQQALADLQAEQAALTPLVVRINRDGALEAIELPGRRIALGSPLLENNPDPEIAAEFGPTFRGDRSPALRICRIAALNLGTADLSRYLVIMAPALPFNDLPHALYDGLRRDIRQCRSEHHARAVLIDPLTVTPAAVPAASPPAAPGSLPVSPSSPPPPPSGSRAVP
jgi:hypothetical protein